MAAIYMWLEGGELVVTTTLYPVETIDELQLEVDVEEISFYPVLFSDSSVDDYGPTGGEILDVLIFGETGESNASLDDFNMTSGFIEDILVFGETGRSDASVDDFNLVDGYIEDKLLYSLHEMSPIQLDIALESIEIEPAP